MGQFSLDFFEDMIEGYEYINTNIFRYCYGRNHNDAYAADDQCGYRGKYGYNDKPFIVRMSGYSMEAAGIPDGAQAVINPFDEVEDGNAALVCYERHGIEFAIKWVHWQTDESVKIRSSHPRFEPRIFSQEDREQGVFCVIGKVVLVITKPLNG